MPFYEFKDNCDMQRFTTLCIFIWSLLSLSLCLSLSPVCAPCCIRRKLPGIDFSTLLILRRILAPTNMFMTIKTMITFTVFLFSMFTYTFRNDGVIKRLLTSISFVAFFLQCGFFYSFEDENVLKRLDSHTLNTLVRFLSSMSSLMNL